jgi:hypothetical protein
MPLIFGQRMLAVFPDHGLGTRSLTATPDMKENE